MTIIDRTARHQMPYVATNQARAEEFHNNALFQLDAVVQLSVISRVVVSPPATPGEGDRFWIPAGSTGDWTGRTGQIAYFVTPPANQGLAGWRYFPAPIGTIVHVQAEDRFFVVSASGVLTQIGSSSGNDSVVERVIATTSRTHAGAGAWENLLSYTIPAGSLMENQLYQVTVAGNIQVATTARDGSIRFTLGGTTIWSDTRAYAASVNRLAWEWRAWLWADGESGKQGFGATFSESPAASAGPPYGDFAGPGAIGCAVDIDDLTEDGATDLDFEIDWLWESTGGTCVISKDLHIIERLF